MEMRFLYPNYTWGKKNYNFCPEWFLLSNRVKAACFSTLGPCQGWLLIDYIGSKMFFQKRPQESIPMNMKDNSAMNASELYGLVKSSAAKMTKT